MFHSITDLIILTMFVSISPQVREAATQSSRGEIKESEQVRKFQETVANIQTEALHWMHRIVPKCYSPSKGEFSHSLQKLLMLENQEAYYVKDNWPVESDRPLVFRLTAEAPLREETLTKLLLLGVTKDQWIKPQELIELADKLIKRSSSLHNENIDMLLIQETKIIELIFNLCPYIPPEESKLPPGYRPPKLAIANYYWKAWIMLLLITAHNPAVFGVLAWDSYPTLRTLMEMCITNSFIFPPPTLAIGEKGEEMTAQEMHLYVRERQQILEFESHLASNTITEQNSLLLSQLITMDPTGPARKPPIFILEQLKSLNAVNKIGHLLCRCRSPDFLLDIIQRQGASQSMPWLAELVQNSEGALSGLPVQCLCEFLLSEAVTGSDGTVAARHHQLLQHLQSLLRSPQQDDGVSVEILEYFLRRLSSQQAAARNQAVQGLQLVVAPANDAMDVDSDPHDPHAWLLHYLPQLPGFSSVRSVASQALRAACQFETNPQSISAYIRFLAVHTREDSLQDQAGLVQDMAQLIVERCTMITTILPGPDRPGHHFPHCHSTLKALLIIFINYMRAVRVLSREPYAWPESPDHVRIQWLGGEQAVMHILVVHAMVILLSYGPSLCSDLFHELLTTWFPEQQQMPTAFLVDTSEEALLLPDWLKLKMIRSTVPQLVDAALRDLEPSQLVLFIQSFGIPVDSMTKLLYALDVAVSTNEEAVAAAVLDKSHKTYMSQLVEVQHQRGAKGGHAFAATLGERDDDIPTDKQPAISPLVTPLEVPPSSRMKFRSKDFTPTYLFQCFTNEALHRPKNRRQLQETMRLLQGHISTEISKLNIDRPYLEQLIDNLNLLLHLPPNHHQKIENVHLFVLGLHDYYMYSAPLFRLLDRLKQNRDCHLKYKQLLRIANEVIRLNPNNDSPLKKVLISITQTSGCKKGQSSSSLSRENTDYISSTSLVSELTVLTHLKATPPHHLEKQIQSLVSVAMKYSKMPIVVSALTQLLVSSVVIKHDVGSNESSQSVALLLDWLHVLDPELRSSPDNLRQLLLFGKGNNKGISKTESNKCGYSQAYLLAAFTHQATWSTLEETVHGLLRIPSTNLDPGSVLDFIWAVLHVPKLWQGRERRTPRHIQQEPLLMLANDELVHLVQYILSEYQLQVEIDQPPKYLQSRISLLFYCLGNSKSAIQNLVEYLVSAITSETRTEYKNAALHLLNQFYLKQPKIFRYLTPDLFERFLTLNDFNDDGQSLADVALHTLLTMLTTPQQSKEFERRMTDLDVAMRKLSSTHPLLVLRHLPLLSASLHGISHLCLEVLKSKNYIRLFIIIIGILELLQPLLFSTQFKKSFCNTLDAFIELLGNHGFNHELGYLLVRLCHLLLAWVGSQGTIAGTYLSRHVNLLISLQNCHPDMTALRSLTAIAASRGTDHPTEQSISNEITQTLSTNWEGPPLPQIMLGQSRDVQLRLESATLSEDLIDLFKKVKDFGEKSNNAILPMFSHIICDGILNSHKKVSTLCWDLLAKLLHFQPSASKRVSNVVLAALHNSEATVVEIAIEHLPEVILLLHDDAPELLTVAFTSCLTSAPTTVNALSEAVALLSIHTGA